MGHGHNNLNDMPSGLRNWGITIAGAVAIGILFLFVGTSWTGPGNDDCCGEQTCETDAHGKEACCKGEAKGAHGEKAACCEGDKAAHADAKACAHACGEECHKAGKCTHECAAECKDDHAHGADSAKKPEAAPAGH